MTSGRRTPGSRRCRGPEFPTSATTIGREAGSGTADPNDFCPRGDARAIFQVPVFAFRFTGALIDSR